MMDKIKNTAPAKKAQGRQYTTCDVAKIIIETMFVTFVQTTNCDTIATFHG